MTEAIAHFGGIDFSGAKEPLGNLWSATGIERGGRLHVTELRPHAFRADLAAFVKSRDERTLWGVNFSCGLPAGAIRHILGDRGGWPELIAWVADRPADEVRDAVPEALRTPRVTDTGGAVPPFDLRSYRQTVEGLRWLHELREEHAVAMIPQAPSEEACCCLVEVNTAATTIDLGLPRRRAPGRPGEHRARAAALRTFLDFTHPESEALAATLEDAWDATLACLTAWLARDDLAQPQRIRAEAREMLELEGWIYRPPAAAGAA